MKTKTIKLPVKRFTKLEDIVKVNNELNEKAKRGELVALRKEKHALVIAEPRINGIWNLLLDSKGKIKEIVLF